MLREPIVQMAYFVEDAAGAARVMARRFGAGPFFLVERIELAWGEHRGEPRTFVHTSAYGQWGPLMMELVQQDEEGPSPFRDMYADGQEGLHHVAMMVDSLAATYAECEAEGLQLAARAQTATGTEFAFIDTVDAQGHMIEVYERSDQLVDFYEFVRTASVGWDGLEVVRKLG